MKRPSFQFYPADWQGNAKLRRCAFDERGVWLEVMCLMHDSEEYGVLRWPLKEIAQAIGCKVSTLKDLGAKGVLKGADRGERIAAFIYTPRHAGKPGRPVELLPEQEGPLWFSSRMVRDEYVRSTAGASTRFQKGTPPRSGGAEGTERARLREAVSAKTGGHCFHCKEPLPVDWEIDHFIPRASGGIGALSNLVPACRPCNQDKSATHPAAWCPPDRRHGARDGSEPSQREGDGPTSPSASTASEGSNQVHAHNNASTAAGRLSCALRDQGVSVTTAHPTLLAWVEAGVTEQIALEAVMLAREKKPKPERIPAGYLDSIIRRMLEKPTPINRAAAKPWFLTWSAIEAKGKELGIVARNDEAPPLYKLRVYKAAGITPEQLKQAESDYR